ncbi:hypothetical protein FXO38_17163 [Capsicum annuum]|nr:hypothetical protein FXO38_17163 [Capsicum annuum]
MEKQLYRLGGIPQVLNVWMFELCFNVDMKVAVKKENNIPCILNWRGIIIRPQFNQFMTRMFIKCSYANIIPTADEIEKLDLGRNSFACDHHDTSSMPSSSFNQHQKSCRANLPQVTEDHDNFVDFSSTPPQFLMRGLIHDVGIEKQNDIAVEEIQPLKSVISGAE